LHKTREETDEYTESGRRIAIASGGLGGLEDVVSNVFARCPAFTIVDVEDGVTKRVTAEWNKSAEGEHGAGPLACTHLIKLGVNVVIGPNFGPTVTKILKEAEIEAITIAPQTKVGGAVQQYIAMQYAKGHRI
jgi:predicted Fe-Mo cluster-binding NifX family protein